MKIGVIVVLGDEYYVMICNVDVEFKLLKEGIEFVILVFVVVDCDFIVLLVYVLIDECEEIVR